MEANTIIIISIIGSAIATFVIALFTGLNYSMYKELKQKDEEYKKQTSNLYRAIVISTLLSSSPSRTGYPDVKNLFLEEYDGKS